MSGTPCRTFESRTAIRLLSNPLGSDKTVEVKAMKNRFAKIARLSVVLGVTWILGMGASAALAGEITGNGKWIAGSPDAPLNGRSDCANSGQQDEPDIDEGFKGRIAQSWGQFPKSFRDFLTSIGLHPSEACNPTNSGGGEP